MSNSGLSGASDYFIYMNGSTYWSGEGWLRTANIRTSRVYESGNLKIDTGSSGHIILSPAGNVGIGTSTPVSKLHVEGNTITTGLGFTGNPGDIKTSWEDIVSAGGGNQWSTSGSGDIYNTGLTNKVGIGTTTPTNTLQVVGSLGVGDTPGSTPQNNRILFNRLKFGDSLNLTFQEAGIPKMSIGMRGNTSGLSFAVGSLVVANTKMYLDTDGDFGIGTTNPVTKLHVNGAITTTGLCFGADCRVSWDEAGSFWTGSSTSNIWNINTGYVGIGTSMPAKKLSVVGDSEFIGDISGTGFLRITNSAANNWVSGKLGIGNATQGASKLYVFGNAAIGTGYSNDNAPDDGLIVQGNVGIGTKTPGRKLDVVGSIRVNNQLISTVSTGTAPFTVTSQTAVTNLNADLLDGKHASAFQTKLTNPVTGSGSTGYLPRFTGATTIGSSNVYSNGTNVGIGTTNPTSKLYVNGAITNTGGL